MFQAPNIPSSPPAPPKKGISGLAILGIGCGGILLIAIVAAIWLTKMGVDKFKEFAANPEKSAAEMMVSMSPELTKVSQDDKKGTMTIRTKDGKEMTLSYKDIAEGRMTMTDANGNTTTLGSTDLSQVPAWVPKADDLSEAISLYHTATGSGFSGQFSGKSSKGVEDLKAFFESAATGAGLSSSSNTSVNLNGASVATMEYSGGGKSLKIVITEKSGSPTLINTFYSEN